MLENFLPLITAGFHGFAVAMLYMGYKLLKTVVARQVEANEENLKRLSILVREIRFFLVISLIFFFAGSGLQLYNQMRDNEIFVLVSPRKMPSKDLMPTILKNNNEEIRLNNGMATIRIKDKSTLDFITQQLVDEVRSNRKIISELTARLGNNDEIGFTDE